MLFQQACDGCTKLIISMYLILQRHYMKREIFNIIIDNIQKAVDENLMCETVDVSNRCMIQIYKKSQCDIHSEVIIDKAPDTSNSEEKLICKKCDMTFCSSKLLYDHIKIRHSNSNKAILCDVCGKVFETPSSLKAHLNCHKVKSCPYCFKILKTHSHYKIHLRSHKGKIIRKRYTKYNCNECDYETKDKGSLEAHINKIHLCKRPYMCEVCLKGFYKKKTLKEHILTHKEVKTVTCEICGDSFIHKKTLLEHLRLHSGEKPYECDICKARFVTSGRRSDHIKRKHMEKSHWCIICNKMYSMQKELKRHMNKVHNSS